MPGTATSYRKFAASAALFFLATAAFAHPHLFFDVQLTVRAGTKGIEGVTLAWTFDKWFSASILLDYDVDGDRWFDETETQSVFDQAFSNLENYDYFTYFTKRGTTVAAERVKEFSVRTEDDRIVYSFFIPLDIPFDSDRLAFNVTVYDKTFFCDIAYHERSPVSLEAPRGFRMDYSIDIDKDVTITYDNQVVGVGRQNETYTGVAHPKSAHIVIWK